MNKPRHQRPGSSSPPATDNGNDLPERESLPAAPPAPLPSAESAEVAGNNGLIEHVRQIVEATPEIRPEKIDPLKKAIDEGTYEIDARKLAKVLITKLILDP